MQLCTAHAETEKWNVSIQSHYHGISLYLHPWKSLGARITRFSFFTLRTIPSCSDNMHPKIKQNEKCPKLSVLTGLPSGPGGPCVPFSPGEPCNIKIFHNDNQKLSSYITTQQQLCHGSMNGKAVVAHRFNRPRISTMICLQICSHNI